MQDAPLNPAEPLSPDPSPIPEERDNDELVHSGQQPDLPPDETEENDEDELVHRIPPANEPSLGEEKDPDDLIHGNG